MSEIIDNRANRIRTLKGIIKHLHAGESPDAVRAQLADIVRETDYSEIVAMEQELMAEGMPVEEIQCMCDLHSQVTRDILVQIPARSVPPGHPVDTFRRENEEIRRVLANFRFAFAELASLAPEASAHQAVLRLRHLYNELTDIEKHYQRKEHTLFPALEKHGITGPSKVMWAKHDEIRRYLKEFGEAVLQTDAKAGEWQIIAQTLGDTLVRAVEEMIYKEENILLPIALDTLTEEDWGEIWTSSPRYGWCLVAPREGYAPPPSVLKEGLKLRAADAVELPTGTLSLEQLLGIFQTLPVDLTFVDADDRVAFFSEGPDRIFARSRAIIGRKVQHCHPPRSVHVVDQILDDFRSGRQSVAEFWIEFHGKFVHIRYFAVRNEKKEYIGTLEVTQDLTRLRRLEGERRLLEYEQVNS